MALFLNSGAMLTLENKKNPRVFFFLLPVEFDTVVPVKPSTKYLSKQASKQHFQC